MTLSMEHALGEQRDAVKKNSGKQEGGKNVRKRQIKKGKMAKWALELIKTVVVFGFRVARALKVSSACPGQRPRRTSGLSPPSAPRRRSQKRKSCG